MNRLITELQRLYCLPHQQWVGGTGTLDLVGPDSLARTLAMDFEKASDWEAVATLWQGVQEELELPAPAISVSGRDGYRVWFSLAELIPDEEVGRFLEALRLRYLTDLPPARLRLSPAAGASPWAGQSQLELPPALHGATGKWSAFIDPALGGMFVDEPGLEMAPNLDKQADLLARFESIKAGDFKRAQAALRPSVEPACNSPEGTAGAPRTDAGRSPSTLGVGSNFSDPKSFLLAVMNDPSADASQRIEAAKALLPYFEERRS